MMGCLFVFSHLPRNNQRLVFLGGPELKPGHHGTAWHTHSRAVGRCPSGYPMVVSGDCMWRGCYKVSYQVVGLWGTSFWGEWNRKIFTISPLIFTVRFPGFQVSTYQGHLILNQPPKNPSPWVETCFAPGHGAHGTAVLHGAPGALAPSAPPRGTAMAMVTATTLTAAVMRQRRGKARRWGCMQSKWWFWYFGFLAGLRWW